MRPIFYQSLLWLTLVVVPINNVLVMVDRPSLALVVARQLGRLEVANVKDVRDGQLARRRALGAVALVQLVVEHEELLV
jgi:hypothetical protein